MYDSMDKEGARVSREHSLSGSNRNGWQVTYKRQKKDGSVSQGMRSYDSTRVVRIGFHTNYFHERSQLSI